MRITLTGKSIEVAFRSPRIDNPIYSLIKCDDAIKNVTQDSSQITVWLYRQPLIDLEYAFVGLAAPSISEIQSWLSTWLKQHRSILRKRREFAGKLILINCDHADLSFFFSQLGMAAEPAALIAGEFGKKDESKLNTIVASRLETAFPEHWDVYEALEALSWDEKSVTPTTPNIINAIDITSFYHEIFKAKNFDLTLASLEAAKKTVSEQTATIAKLTQDAAASKVAGVKVGTEIRQTTEILTKVQSENKEQKLSIRSLETEIDSLRAENVHIKRANQTKLFEHQAVITKIQEKTAVDQALYVNEMKLGTEKQQSLAAKILLLQDKLKANEAADENNKEILKDITEENELLLQQMHQVQEELERQFLQNRDMNSVLDLSSEALTEARMEISRNYVSSKSITVYPVI